MEYQKSPLNQDLAQILSLFRDRQEIFRFLRDLLTKQEMIELHKRWQAAQMLAQKIPYTEISHQTGLSSATIAKTARWYKKGLGGYKLAIKRWEKFGDN